MVGGGAQTPAFANPEPVGRANKQKMRWSHRQSPAGKEPSRSVIVLEHRGSCPSVSAAAALRWLPWSPWLSHPRSQKLQVKLKMGGPGRAAGTPPPHPRSCRGPEHLSPGRGWGGLGRAAAPEQRAGLGPAGLQLPPGTRKPAFRRVALCFKSSLASEIRPGLLWSGFAVNSLNKAGWGESWGESWGMSWGAWGTD